MKIVMEGILKYKISTENKILKIIQIYTFFAIIVCTGCRIKLC